MLVIRHNFETNSSSMHSLSIRKTGGAYTDEEIMRSEAIADTALFDAIITLKSGERYSNEQIKETSWIWNDRLHIWSHDLCFFGGPMEVLTTFRDKLRYAIATVCGFRYRGWEKRYDEIKALFEKILPGVKLDAEIENSSHYRYREVGVAHYILPSFLKENKITLEEFLTNSKYIVIVDYNEYKKMKWLGMVDETNIENIFAPYENDQGNTINIVDGVWKIRMCDIGFGRSPFRVLGTPEGKARYALATFRGNNADDVISILKELYPDLESIEFPKSEYDGETSYGYCDDSAFPHDVPLREFILDKKYVIISDGDEYCVWPQFKQTPIFNRDEYPDEKIDED